MIMDLLHLVVAVVGVIISLGDVLVLSARQSRLDVSEQRPYECRCVCAGVGVTHHCVGDRKAALDPPTAPRRRYLRAP